MSNEQINETNSSASNSQSYFNEFYENTADGQFDIIKWMDCPSCINSEDILKEKLFNTISFSRCAALMRLSTLYSQDEFMSSKRNAFLSPQAFQINPLFRSIPSTIIQTVTNLFQRFYTIPDQVADEVVDFFTNKSPSFSDVFSTVTFPAIFFYFMTTEFSEAGSIFIEHCLALSHDRFTSSLLASFFDCFPRFSETLWQTFQKKCAKKSVFTSFLHAISESFRQLTPHHSRLIKILNENDPKFVSDFFFRQYFLPRARMRYYTACSDEFLNVFIELSRILNYCSFNYGSPHQQILMNAIIESQSESLTTQELSYVLDIQLPCVFSLLSGFEISFLREFLLESNLFKFKATLKESQIPPAKAESMLPGYVQFSAKPISSRAKRSPISIIFNNLQEKSNDENDFTEEEVANFERVWNQVLSTALINGLTVPQLINMKNPKNQEIQAVMNSTTVKSIRFRSFMLKKLNEKKNYSEKAFEIFIGRLQTQRELSRILEDFKRDSQMCMWKNAQEFVLEKCISQENFSSTIINEDEPQKYVSNSLKFMTFRYKENISCQHFYLKHLQQQNQTKKQLFDQQQNKQQQQIQQVFFDSNSAYRSNICQFCSFYSNDLNESSENLPEKKVKKDEKNENIMKMKAEKFEDLLCIVNSKENIPQFNYHYALAILNEWPTECEGMDEIRRDFAFFSDKRRCFLVKKEKIVTMISQNKFVLKVFKKMQNLRDLKLGNQIYELVQIIWQLNLVYDKFFKNNDDFILVKSFEEFACNCFFFAGVDELIVSFIWFTRLVTNFRQYINALSPKIIEVFIAVTDEMFDTVKKSDTKLSLKLNIAVIKVPKCI